MITCAIGGVIYVDETPTTCLCSGQRMPVVRLVFTFVGQQGPTDSGRLVGQRNSRNIHIATFNELDQPAIRVIRGAVSGLWPASRRRTGQRPSIVLLGRAKGQ